MENKQTQSDIETSIKQWTKDTEERNSGNPIHRDNRAPVNAQAEADIKKWAKERK
jgi:hypothetical protein